MTMIFIAVSSLVAAFMAFVLMVLAERRCVEADASRRRAADLLDEALAASCELDRERRAWRAEARDFARDVSEAVGLIDIGAHRESAELLHKWATMSSGNG